MICHDRKCIFIHTRKSAGTSIKSLLGGDKNALLNDGILDKDWEHQSKNLEEYFVFTVVRNPWDKFLSAKNYCWCSSDMSIEDVLRFPPRPDIRNNLKELDIPSSIKRNYERTISRMNLLQKGEKGYRSYGHDYRHLMVEQMSRISYDNSSFEVDAVLYLEDLHGGLSQIANFINLGHDYKLDKQNVNRAQSDYRDKFKDIDHSLFQAHFYRDIHYLGYTFEDGISGLPQNHCDVLTAKGRRFKST